ncbi:MAG: chloride channel protein [Nitrososphaeria archaeon]
MYNRIYIRTFYWFKNKAFKRMNVTNYLKPAIGGLALGLSTIFLPQVLGGGYGWVQLAIYGQIGLMTMLSIGLLKIIATSLTIGSGGSGGVFAPSLMIGGTLGGAIGTIFNTAFPKLAPEPCAVIIIGMAAFFAGAAHVPIAAMIMVAEMTGDYGLIPAMLTCTITYLAVGKRTIYEKQVLTRVDSPAHRDEFLIDVLEQIPVSKVFTKRVDVLSPRSSVKELARLISDTGHHGFPVVEDGRVVGVVTSSDILKVPTIEAESKKVEEIISRSLYVTYPHENLALALHKMQSYNIG